MALDFAFLLRYVRLLGNATTAAKLGYALEAGRERLAVPTAVLDELRLLAPRQPHPAERGLRRSTRLVRPWNLLVPVASQDEPPMEEGWDPEKYEGADVEREIGERPARGVPGMRLSREGLQREAAATGFRPEVLEKVFLLLDLPEAVSRHPGLSGKLALKGGTALNLFLFGTPRLSAPAGEDSGGRV